MIIKVIIITIIITMIMMVINNNNKNIIPFLVQLNLYTDKICKASQDIIRIKKRLTSKGIKMAFHTFCCPFKNYKN